MLSIKIAFKKIMLLPLVLSLSVTACGKKKKNQGADVDAKLRSTGQATSLAAVMPMLRSMMTAEDQALLDTNPLATSSFTIESYTVPIGGISLAQGLQGTGYTGGSPIYICPGTTDDDCRVDLSKKINVDNLLNGAGKQNVVAGTYAGIAVEFCFEHSSQKEGTGNGYFDIKFKGSTVLGTTTYYTNTTSGLSSTGPSQEITMRLKGSGCGVTTALLSPLTLNDKDSTTVALYADPNGSLLATDSTSSFSNLACVGTDPSTLCAQPVAVYAVNDTAIPTIERYTVTFTDTAGTSYANGMIAALFNSSDQAVGAMMTNVFTNKRAARALAGNFNFTQVKNNADGTITFVGYKDPTTNVDVISNLSRKASSTGTLTQYVSSPLTWTAVKQ